MENNQLISKLKTKYSDKLKEKGVIQSELVEQAFRKVDRHQLIEDYYQVNKGGELEYGGRRYTRKHLDSQDLSSLKEVYADRALLTKVSPPSSSSQPSLVAAMLEKLNLEQGMDVLEIGAGTGYNAALIKEMVGNQGSVTTMDIQEDIVSRTEKLLKQIGYEDIEVILGDGAAGFPSNAPYHRIVATVECPDISLNWDQQLDKDGFMLVPLQHGGQTHDPLVRIWREEEELAGQFAGYSGFMSIQGQLACSRGVRWEYVYQTLKGDPKEEIPFKSLGRKEIFSFSLFLALNHQERHCTYYPPIGFWTGLWGEQGAALMGKGKINLYGEEPPYQDLKESFNRWEELERPDFTDYEIRFLSGEEIPVEIDQEKGWRIERENVVEVVKLK